MSNVPENVILIWPGTNASIPVGWTRATSLDSKYPKSWGDENPGDTGGNATHSHTSSSHSHTMISHSHSVGTTTAILGDSRGNDGGSSAVYVFHTHTTTLSGVVGGTISGAVTYASTDTLPPYFSIIYIKPDGSPQLIADDTVALWYETAAPSGFAFTDGNGGTVDLRNKYLRGAIDSGDGGGTSGTLNHSHSINHSHSTVGHTHSGTSAGPSPMDAGTGVGSPVSGSHTHSISLPSVTSATNSYSGNAGTADDVEPAYKKVMAIQNTSGVDLGITKGLIALWLESTGTIPGGWFLCDGANSTPDLRNKYIKIANTTGEIGDTGGSNTHTHTASNSHTHTATGTHTHSTGGSLGWYGTNVSGISGGSANSSPITHYHNVGSVTSATATYNTSTVSGDSSSSEPEYVIAAYIMQGTYVQDFESKGNIVRFNEEMESKAGAKIAAVEKSFAKAYIPTYKQSSKSKVSLSESPYRKSFDYRVYDGDTFVSNWSEDVISEPSFRAVINGGPGEMIVKLARTFDDFGEDIDVKLFNTVEVWCFDREAPSGTMIYSGFISGYRPIIDGHSEYIEITLLHQIAKMSNIILRDAGGDTKIAMNSYDPSQMLKDIIDYYRADSGLINYTSTSVKNTNTTVSYTFNIYTTKEALDKVINLTPENWFWRVDADNVATMSNFNIAKASHVFQVGKNISYMETWRRAEDLVNRVYFVGQESGGVPKYRVYSNTGSVNSYGIHATKMVDSRVELDSTADVMAGTELSRRKDPEIRTMVTITDSNGHDSTKGYDIEQIRPGHSIQIRDIKQPKKTQTLWDIGIWDDDVWDQTLAYAAADILQIVAIEYSPESVRIEASSRMPEISKRMEDIYRNWEESVTWDVPQTPTAG